MSDLVPNANIHVFSRLYEIENGLRELVIEELQGISGPRWFKQHLPGDILEKYRKAREYEESIVWSQLVPHHPMYYIDFPDLKKIIEKNTNWTAAFEKIFRSSGMLTSTLAGLDFLRNRIAHNRKVSEQDVAVVDAAALLLSNCIGEPRWTSLARRCTVAPSIIDQFSRLHSCITGFHSACCRFAPFTYDEQFDEIALSWWMDEDYLQTPIEAVESYLSLMKTYSSFERRRGCGHELEQLVNTLAEPECYARVLKQIEPVLRRKGIGQWT